MSQVAVKKMDLLSMFFLSLNCIVGSGLFLLPGQVAAVCGNWGLVFYVVVALMILALGWCYAMCSRLYTRNGGPYLYAKEAFGDFIGFEVGLIRCVVSSTACASLTSGCVVALGSLCPLLLETPIKQCLIISLIGGLSLLNLFGTNVIKNLSNVITVSKLLLVICFIGFGLFAIQPEYLFALADTPPIPSMAACSTAVLIIFYAFNGFEVVSFIAAETDNPKRNIPIALMSGIICSSILYFIIQSICIGVLGDSLSSSASPIMDVAEAAGGGFAKLFVFIAMLISIGGVLVVSSFTTPRTFAALAQEQKILLSLAKQNSYGAPSLAIAFSMAITCVVALSGTFVELVTISVISRFVQHISTTAALFAFEKKGMMQPFTAPWKRAIPIFALASMVWLLSQAEGYQVICGLGVLVLGVPLYFIQKQWAAKELQT
ncbi:MAG: APC family permease [Verrucomicrobia bacterium]|nr:APC family permease [Verrucomicrobiota bacterium]